jgi:hypothetical protein
MFVWVLYEVEMIRNEVERIRMTAIVRPYT